jgi:alanine dehydrogenase
VFPIQATSVNILFDRVREALDHSLPRHLPVGLCEGGGSQGRSLHEEAHVENWQNKKTLILSRTDMIGLLAPEEYNDCVEQAFRMFGEDRVYMEPKGHIVLDKYPGEWEIMPSYLEEPESAACKWVSIRFDNRERYGLPTVFSILVYSHPETGFPLAICDGSHHTNMRTGASAAVSAKWLARPDSKVLTIVGAGDSARGAIKCCRSIFDWTDIRVWSRSQSTRDGLAAEVAGDCGHLPISYTEDLETAVRGADVVVTVTPSTEPLVKDEWIEPGTHFACIGGGLAGSQELEPAILKRARIFTDDVRQCKDDGEINVPLSKGELTVDDVTGDFGAVVAGTLEGRQSDEQITVFDSTGIALQDSATIPLEYERAIEAGVGVEKKMISV